jgi:beta-phosphoglucomutase family hydrolase
MAKAFLFDLNGTMVDDMNYHITAWHRIVNELGANLSIEQVKAECYGKNGEVLERIFPNRFSDEEKNRMSIEKEKQYQQEFRPQLKLLDGLDHFLDEAKKRNIKMAIGSAAIMFNVDFVLDGLHIRHYIDAIVSADDVTHSKPHPETFLNCADELGITYEDCIVFEDAPKGVEAAANAGMKCAVLTTMHTKEEFAAYRNIIAFAEDFTDPVFLSLLEK